MLATLFIIYGFAGGLNAYVNEVSCAPKEKVYCSQDRQKELQSKNALQDKLLKYQCSPEQEM